MRAHVPLGFDATQPITCVSSHLGEVTEVVIYVPKERSPKAEEALNAFLAFLKGAGKRSEVVYLNPCDGETLFQMVMNMGDDNLICGGSGLRVLGLQLLLACVLSRSRCKLWAGHEGGGPCLDLRVPDPFESKLEARAYAALALKGEASLDELSKELGVNKKTLWSALERLEKNGLVEKPKRGIYRAKPLS
ncbi:helix-turn-helix domain-containing protein [Ignicoccus hospitalis]|uniref:Transcriptional regulator, TrmB n=1 Tax=Ignicoccus hospitalis (strain KIN4/I / DSM 18386 / JCM 14125) TaxID=453591 RepID=A8ABL7_IGNH4|nr:helix-turn-helix domain-containing protein [Ignicoccus hospitalis]ABU82319.1 transcriptional regulator, TrmB [Ignicoccus hospitalis KIN4/I]HIH89827.1 winged helix-turn-helix transcriptional regulator [Desulfurococcaceae archaeon]